MHPPALLAMTRGAGWPSLTALGACAEDGKVRGGGPAMEGQGHGRPGQKRGRLVCLHRIRTHL